MTPSKARCLRRQRTLSNDLAVQAFTTMNPRFAFPASGRVSSPKGKGSVQFRKVGIFGLWGLLNRVITWSKRACDGMRAARNVESLARRGSPTGDTVQLCWMKAAVRCG